MNRNSLAVILAVVLANQLTFSEGGKIKTVLKVIDSIFELYEIFKAIYDRVVGFQNPQPTASEIFSTLNNVALKLDATETQLVRKMDVILDTLLNRFPEIMEIRSDMQLLRGYVQRIDSLYDTFRSFSTNCSDWNPLTLLDFSESVTDYSPDSVAHTMDYIFSIINPSRTAVLSKGLLLRIIRNFKESELDACDEEKSPQQQIYDFYTTILATELRGWLLISFAYTFRSSFNNTNSNSTCVMPYKNAFIGEQRYTLERFHMRIDTYTRKFHEAMSLASRALRRCDPSNGHTRGSIPLPSKSSRSSLSCSITPLIPGDTFHEFERFIHGYIMEEKRMNSLSRCTQTCESVIPVFKYDPLGCYPGIGAGGTNACCFGEITDCKSIGSTEVCTHLLTNFENRAPSRLYDWFKDERGDAYGNINAECRGELHHPQITYVSAYYARIHCDICVCTCMEDSYDNPAYRFVSLREVVSDIENNKVVTGVKFISTKNVIQIQIQEGELAKDGTIEESSDSWKEPEQIHDSQSLTLEAKKRVYEVIRPFENSSISFQTNDDDVAVFNRRRHTIYLDELHVPKNHVMTGIKFDRIQFGRWRRYYSIQLSIRATPFDYAKGTLVNKTASIWITPEHMKNILAPYERERMEIPYGDDLKNPIQQVLKNRPNFEPNKFIKIKRTSLKSDAGQTVIPLWDGLGVTANPAVPLAGVNLFHKSADNYGGFLSFQILTLNRTEYAIERRLSESIGSERFSDS